MKSAIAIVPKLTLTGGNLEVQRLLADLNQAGINTKLLPIFPKNFGKLVALILLPLFYLRIFYRILLNKPSFLVLTHYSTLPLALISILGNLRIISFVQDFEWLFPSRFKFIQSLMKQYHFLAYNLVDCFVFGNRYLYDFFPRKSINLSSKYKKRAIIVYPVGSISSKSYPRKNNDYGRCYDIGLILRNGWLKNEVMHYKVLETLLQTERLSPGRVSAIDMLSATSASNKYRALGIDIRTEMNHEDLCSWMTSIDIFLCLSIHEGFGLPPMEAMALGAIPLVLSNGGCSAYMGCFPDLILPLSSSPGQISNKINSVLTWPKDYRKMQEKLLKNHAATYLNSSMQLRRLAAQEIARL